MSKEFTPRECWAANSYIIKQTGADFLDSMKALVKGEEKVI